MFFYKMSCLFNSIQRALNVTNTREKICDYMLNNSNECINGDTVKYWIQLTCSNGETIDTYIKKMKSSSTWGGGLELAIASKMFDTKIHIKYTRTNKIISIFDCGANEAGSREIYLSYTGGHYEPILNAA